MLDTDRSSGSKNDRPDGRQASPTCAKDDVLVVWKLDRLGRSLSHLLGSSPS